MERQRRLEKDKRRDKGSNDGVIVYYCPHIRWRESSKGRKNNFISIFIFYLVKWEAGEQKLDFTPTEKQM